MPKLSRRPAAQRRRFRSVVGDVVEFGTIEGARAMGMENEIGSLTPGKRADLIKFDTKAPGVTPMINPFGTIVYSGQTALVDTVLINGKTVKKDGKLVDVDMERIHRLAYESLDYLFEQAKEDPGISDAHRRGDWVPEPYEPEAA